VAAPSLVGSRFTGNVCSNGAALSSIGVSWTVLGSRFVGNRAIGFGANPAKPGTPGGGSGGAIYNDRAGTMSIRNSSLIDNPNDEFQTPGLPGIYFLGARRPAIRHSVLSGPVPLSWR
jgi:hypothetical protein